MSCFVGCCWMLLSAHLFHCRSTIPVRVTNCTIGENWWKTGDQEEMVYFVHFTCVCSANCLVISCSQLSQWFVLVCLFWEWIWEREHCFTSSLTLCSEATECCHVRCCLSLVATALAGVTTTGNTGPNNQCSHICVPMWVQYKVGAPHSFIKWHIVRPSCDIMWCNVSSANYLMLIIEVWKLERNWCNIKLTTLHFNVLKKVDKF